MGKFTLYLEQYALISLEKRMKLTTMIGEHTSELDLDSGTIIFNNGLAFPFQVLGTESDNTLSWLWGWAEEQTEIPGDLLASSLLLKDWGKREGIEEFITPSVDINKADGHAFSLISTEIIHASCYYRSPYEGGAVFILIFGRDIDRQPPFDLDGLTREFLDLTLQYELNHRSALVSYLRGNNLPFTEKGPFVSGKLATGETLTAEFDEMGHLKTMDGKTVS